MKLYIILLPCILLIAACTSEIVEIETETPPVGEPEAKHLGGKTTKIYSFSQKAFIEAQQNNHTIVLYFTSTWCESCKEELQQLRSAVNRVGNPEMTIFEVNYRDNQTWPSETTLAARYNVTRHQTKVILSQNKTIYNSPDYWDTNTAVRVLTSPVEE